MSNYKDMTKEELIKALKEKEEENSYLAENINNKDVEINQLKEKMKKDLDYQLNSMIKEKDNEFKNMVEEKSKELKTNVDNYQAQLNNLSTYVKRREDELTELINLTNNVVTCIDAFSSIVKYANGEVLKKITKEN